MNIHRGKESAGMDCEADDASKAGNNGERDIAAGRNTSFISDV